MPVVISLLNAFTGLAASATGFVLHNNVLIVAGALVGASGTLLTLLMGRAMNRSIGERPLRRVRRGAGGRRAAAVEDGRHRPLDDCRRTSRSCSPTRARSSSCPGYGLAVAQAQHDVRALADLLEEKGVDVQYGDPPGRRPHAGPHERAARRGERALRPAEGDGRDQPRAAADGRRRHPRRERRRQPGRAERPGQPDLRHADHRGRPGCERRRREAVAQPRLRGHRQPALLRPEDVDAVRRREGGARGVVAAVKAL